MIDTLIAIDTKIFFALNSMSGASVFDKFNEILSGKEIWLVLIPVLIAVTLVKGKTKGKQALLAVVVSAAFTDFFTYQALKLNFERLRPCKEYPEQVITPTGCKSQYGFPSNHAANSGAIAGAILFSGYKVLGGALIGVAVLISLSRVFLGVHYPADITVGILSGLIYSYLIVLLLKRLYLWKLRKNDETSIQSRSDN